MMALTERVSSISHVGLPPRTAQPSRRSASMSGCSMAGAASR